MMDAALLLIALIGIPLVAGVALFCVMAAINTNCNEKLKK